MKEERKGFQLILLIVFGVFFALGVLAFAGILPGFSTKQEKANTFLGNVTIWGTLPQSALTKVIDDFNNANKQIVSVSYNEKIKNTFDTDLVEALAEGTGPDVILLPQDLIMRHRNKIYPIPFEIIPERTFKDSFIEEGELYLNPTGILALPLIVDPIVMYWNRDIFSSALISRPPVYWDEFFNLVPIITKLDTLSNIKQSLVSFGEFDNVANAKDILSMLIMQAGSPITALDTYGKSKAVLSENLGYSTPPADEALRFYTEFSNPTKTSYSWNGSLPYSRDMFTTGGMGLYFGYASEYENLKKKNPHLNFDVAVVPQARNAGIKLTFGRMQGFAIMKSSKNIQASITAVQLLSKSDTAAAIADALRMPPMRRDLLSRKPNDAYLSVFYDSALISHGFLDPSPSETNQIFQGIVSDITSGRRQLSAAVGNGNAELTKLLRVYNK